MRRVDPLCFSKVNVCIPEPGHHDTSAAGQFSDALRNDNMLSNCSNLSASNQDRCMIDGLRLWRRIDLCIHYGKILRSRLADHWKAQQQKKDDSHAAFYESCSDKVPSCHAA